jgi:SNF2 family DNA or RNA helicase
MQTPPFIVSCERIPRRQAYYVKFPINDQIIERIREFPEESRKWNAGRKSWELTTTTLLGLIKKYKGSTKIYFDFGNEDSRKVFISQIKKIESAEFEKQKAIKILNQNKENWIKYKLELEKNYENYSDYVHSFLKEGTKLYKHQIVAALFMSEVKNTLLALDMGTGKSISAIATCEMNKFEKVVVITPNSLKFNYMQEIKKFSNSKYHVVYWKKNEYTIEEAKYIILNYEFFNSKDKDYCNKKWNDLNVNIIDALILDECQKIKNSSTNLYKNYKRIFNDNIFRNNKKFSMYLSGTPLINRVKELYTVLHEISPLDFKTKKYFLEYYCGMTYNYNEYGWTVDEEITKFEELFHKISPFIYRKKIEDVIDSLPKKSYQKIILELDDKEQNIYNKIEEGVYNEFTNSEIKNKLVSMLRLRQFTSQCKLKYICELIDNVIETGEKLVIFDVFKDTLKQIHEKYLNISVLHTGDEKIEERSEAIKKFQDKNNEIKLFLSTFASGNFGITLTEASKMFLITLPYSLGEYSQSFSRIYRIGQKNNVILFPILFRNTIDEYVDIMINSKQTEFSKIMDNENYKLNTDESVLGDVIKMIKEKYDKK